VEEEAADELVNGDGYRDHGTVVVAITAGTFPSDRPTLFLASYTCPRARTLRYANCRITTNGEQRNF
jgi:hypothetical protein